MKYAWNKVDDSCYELEDDCQKIAVVNKIDKLNWCVDFNKFIPSINVDETDIENVKKQVENYIKEYSMSAIDYFEKLMYTMK